jgi:hypothetical protein
METIQLSIVADPGVLEMLVEAAEDLSGVTITQPRPIDPSGEGLGFPIDGKFVMDALEVAAIFIATADSLTTLVEKWLKRRDLPTLTSETSPQRMVIADIRTGEVLYEGPDLDQLVVLKILKRSARRAGD